MLERLVDRLRDVKYDLMRYAARHDWAAVLYYALVSPALRREMRSVLYGRYRYHRGLGEAQDSQTLLRRNVHKIEKGLTMRPRRDVFAAGYISQTVDAFLEGAAHDAAGGAPASGNAPADSGANGNPAFDNPAFDNPELRWARDVLTEYFQATGAHPQIDAAEALFEAHASPNGAERRAPYQRDLGGQQAVDYEAFWQLARQRRSVRWFRPDPVPRELIDKAVAAAAQAPSACNRQPFYFRIFDDPERVREIAELPGGTGGYAHNIPVIAVVIGRQRAYYRERDRHVIYIDGSLAAMSMMYALETMGLSSCPINWPDVEEREQRMAEALDLDPDERPIMLMAIGYPDPEGMVAYSEKKPLAQIRSYN